MTEPIPAEDEEGEPLGARLWQWQMDLRRTLGHFVFPPRCPVSEAPLLRHDTLSPDVWRQLRFLSPPWCYACGRPFDYQNDEEVLCAACAAPDRYDDNLTGRGKLDKLRSALAYDDHIAPGVLRLKYADRTDGVKLFSRLMVGAGRDLLAEGVLIPVPLHRDRLARRRYNQAGQLADAIGERAGLPVDHLSLRRIRPTPSQKASSRSERKRHVAGAFAVRQPDAVRGQTVILVDDVLTTGATLLACARALRKAGVIKVFALTLARVVTGGQTVLYEG